MRAVDVENGYDRPYDTVGLLSPVEPRRCGRVGGREDGGKFGWIGPKSLAD